MMIHNALRIIMALAISICILVAPLPAHAFFSDITIVDEAEMGREFDKQVRAMLPLVDDPIINEYVARVVKRVYSSMPPQPFQVKTAVVRNGSLNAFAIPGGYVYVFTGLLAQLETEDQLAAVIGHELAHVSQRHVVDRIQKMEKVSLLSLAGTLAGIFIGATGSGNTREAGQALMVGSQAAATTAFLNYTQENEREADHVGIQYLIDAGYNPKGMPETFDLMLRNQYVGKNNKLPNYLRTHPKLSERSSYLNNRIAEMAAKIINRPTSAQEFLKIRALVRGRMSDPTWAQATLTNKIATDRTCYDSMALGMVEGRLRHLPEAKSAFDDALVCGHNDPLIIREAGIFNFKFGDYDNATKYLQKAMFLNPDDIYTLFFNARLLGEKRNYSDAIRYLEAVLLELDTDWEVYYHLGKFEGARGNHFYGHMYLSTAWYYKKDLEKAKFHYKKAESLADTKEKQDLLAEYIAKQKED